MTRWHRHVRLALGIFALAFGVVVYFSIRASNRPPPPAPGSATGPNVVAMSTHGKSILLKGSKQDIRIEYDSQVTYQSGRTKSVNAKLFILERAGRNFEVTAGEAEVAENQSQIDMRRGVGMKTSDGLLVKTNDATYTRSDEVVRAPGAVSFARDRMTGTSVGATYDQERDVLWLLDQARVTIAPDAQGAGGATVTAGAAGYARRDRYIRFERGVKMARGAQMVEADGALAHLKADRDELQMLELRGNARVAGVGQAANGLQAMHARDMNLRYADDGQTLQAATLIGSAVVQLAAAGGAPGPRLAGESIEIEMTADGQAPQMIAAQDAVQLDLPASGGALARQIRSVSFDARGEPGSTGLRSARFTDRVEFRETSPATASAPAVERLVRAPKLEAKLRDGLSTIDEARFTEGVSVKDGARDAAGPTLVYDVAGGGLALIGPQDGGSEGGARALTRVNDERASIEARRLDLTVDGSRVVADGLVKSVLKAQSAKPASGSQADAIKRPSMLAGDQAVNVTAGHLVYERKTGRAEYTADAQLWQGQTSIKAKSITLDEASGNLSASGDVRSVMRLESKEPDRSTQNGAPGQVAAPPTTPAKPPSGARVASRSTDTIATAADLVYDDAQRRATYTTTARLVGEQGDLRAEKIEIYLDESGRGLERLEGYSAVSVKSGTRWGKGERMTYFAVDERYVLSGSPVHVVDQRATECRETTGRTLTFFRATDSIIVDGNDATRTQTKSGGKCSEPVP